MTRMPPNVVSFAAAMPKLPGAAMAEAGDLPPGVERTGATAFGVSPDALTIIQVAVAIEPDPGTVLAWYRRVRIAELGGFTAEQLVLRGQSECVMAFLDAILRGERG